MKKPELPSQLRQRLAEVKDEIFQLEEYQHRHGFSWRKRNRYIHLIAERGRLERKIEEDGKVS